jgi:hypothetical protein
MIMSIKEPTYSMSPLTSQNVESELSYAYIHAIAASARAACEVSGRHADNAGVDAKLTAWGPFPNGGFRQEVDLKIQLKATVQKPTIVGDCWSYFLRGQSHYDDLRSLAMATPRILVVLYLPEDEAEWISHTEDALALRKCAYWVSLRGAPASSNSSGQTVHIPRSQRFDTAGLSSLLSALSRAEIPAYNSVQA